MNKTEFKTIKLNYNNLNKKYCLKKSVTKDNW